LHELKKIISELPKATAICISIAVYQFTAFTMFPVPASLLQEDLSNLQGWIEKSFGFLMNKQRVKCQMALGTFFARNFKVK